MRSYLLKRKANSNLREKNELISLQSEELKITNEMLAEMDSFKQEMTGMLVHDLKNPLNAIIGLTQQEYKAQHQKTIYQSGQNMLNLVSNMLDVQKLEEAKMNLEISRVNLRELLLGAFRQVEYLFTEKNIQFNLDSNESVMVHLDAELIERVVVNLLHNAIKYTPNNGQVSLIVENLNSPNTQLKISVIDSGIGIPANLIDKIFDKYHRINPEQLGTNQATGLGLTFCKLAIEAHQGEIEVKSTEGQGSTFWFTLPLNLAVESDKTDPQPQIQDSLPLVVNELTLQTSEKTYLAPFVEKIKQFEVFEVTAIKPILQSIEEATGENIEDWKDALEESMYASNVERFEELLNMVV